VQKKGTNRENTVERKKERKNTPKRREKNTKIVGKNRGGNLYIYRKNEKIKTKKTHLKSSQTLLHFRIKSYWSKPTFTLHCDLA
jgi:hypothetical protein